MGPLADHSARMPFARHLAGSPRAPRTCPAGDLVHGLGAPTLSIGALRLQVSQLSPSREIHPVLRAVLEILSRRAVRMQCIIKATPTFFLHFISLCAAEALSTCLPKGVLSSPCILPADVDCKRGM